MGPAFSHIRFPLMEPSQLANGPIKKRIFTPEEMAQIFEMKFAAPGPANAAPAFFSSAPRKNRPALEVGRLSFELEWNSRPGMWMKVLEVDVVPDIKTCPQTSRRFMDLCRMSYSFPIRVCSRTFHQRSHDLKWTTLGFADSPTYQREHLDARYERNCLAVIQWESLWCADLRSVQ
ncbi:hypothetical protein RvY_14459-2 [Ramazzottius varieornatus]|uniref:Uncharacterized protein n=1 Tax=Ramazzottius varieornatus TaxID=947166 RepID=A0A1D1VRD6_RAMVA|nr:hypothetical protein RvY_14459-2 [Ramazzottius varieornatus]